jgi:hypothetical protein
MSVTVTSRDVPIEVRYEAARVLVVRGELEPLDALAAMLFGDTVMTFDSEPTQITGACTNGHPWTDDSTYTRPNGTRVCRICARAYLKTVEGRRRYAKSKEPCIICGAPATAPVNKSNGGMPYARCRSCFHESRRRKALA